MSSPSRLFAALFASGFSGALWAQTVPAADQVPASRAGGEVVVLSAFEVSSNKDVGYRASNSISGSRIDTPIKDLPFALQAFTQEFVEDLNPRELFDVVRFAPGVTMRSEDFQSGNARFSIRGFDMGAYATLRNGLPGPALFDAANIQRVEVVKGPASFLYGQLAPGGLVNVISKRPLGYASTTIRAEVGTDDYYRAVLDTSAPIGDSGLAYRLTGSWTNDFRYYDPYKSEQGVIAPSLSWRFKNVASITVDYERLVKHEDPPLAMKPNMFFINGAAVPIGPFYPLPKEFNIVNNADYRDSKMDNLVIEANLKLGAHWDARAAYSDQRRDITYKAHGIFGAGTGATASADVPATPTQPAILRQDANARRPRILNDNGSADTFQLEAVGKYKFQGVSLRVLAGWNYEEATVGGWNRQVPVALWRRPWDLSNPATWDRVTENPLSDYQLLSDTVADVETSAYYVGTTFGFLNDRLLALGGARRTDTENSSLNLINGVRGRTFQTDATTPQVGAMFKVSPALGLFASYSESFVPNNNLLRINGNPTTPALPTEGEGYEAGAKLDLLEGKLSGTVTVFQVENTNLVQTLASFDPVTGGSTFNDFQSGVQESDGVEVDMVWTPNDQFQLYVSYSHQNPVYKDNPQNRALEGKLLQSATKNLANVWMKYRLTGGLKGFYVAGGANWQSKQQQRQEDPNLFFPAYALFDAQIGYQTKIGGRDTTIELAGKNLTDKEYFPSNNSRGQLRRFILSISTRL